MANQLRQQAKLTVYGRKARKCPVPMNEQGKYLKVSQYFGENVYNYHLSKSFSAEDKEILKQVIDGRRTIDKPLATKVANSVMEWAIIKGATHFCHWFQPLTGSTAEKHDAFLSFDNDRPIEMLSASQLMQGEPDASSFPNGGSRATFEARGYTTWDLTSPLFIQESVNGKTLVIPTAFVSYHGDALDTKTPLLRSDLKINEVMMKFCNLIGMKDVNKVYTTCGAEQEYFLIDKAFYFGRQDLVMTGRALFGSLTSRNQQLEDHYFGLIEDRVLGYMQEVEIELYKMGIPAKTRHNEVAPGQYELAPIFKDANVAADNNQIVMTVLRTVALKHDFVCLLHEKPFAGVNGSGKHLNWSMSTDTGVNFLEPGNNPHENFRFLAVVATVCEAVYRHADIIRMGIASHGNDHRLGANEAPPSIMSVFLGDTLTKILDSMVSGGKYVASSKVLLDLGARQLADLFKDNTDRNRTSPFAFTGNKFEFRACGSSASIGYPLSILNAAVIDIFEETNKVIEDEIAKGKSADDALTAVILKWYGNAQRIVFNGDGYSQDWVKEAAKRGLGNMRTTPEAISVLKDSKKTNVLITSGVFTESEISTRYNVMLERYIKCRDIELKTLIGMVLKQILPVAIEYKTTLAESVKKQKDAGCDHSLELELLKNLAALTASLHSQTNNLATSLDDLHKGHDEENTAKKIAMELMPESVRVADLCNQIEEILPDENWPVPKYYDMLFIR
ncbi:MAG TPA: glutamine synthetase III [Bacteriovoracaceae bacterium]|nr:glutamine synthetase III [Bacteriovoracaceae bacterium]